MNTADNVIRAARHLITVHGDTAEKVALARAESASASKCADVATIWHRIAAAVRAMQTHPAPVTAVP